MPYRHPSGQELLIYMVSIFHEAMTLTHASVTVFWAREINPPRFSVTVISGAVKNGVLFAEIRCVEKKAPARNRNVREMGSFCADQLLRKKGPCQELGRTRSCEMRARAANESRTGNSD